jgi:hypothetical protein
MSAYPHAPNASRTDRLAAWSVFLILLAVYTATFCGLPDNPDAEVEFQTTRAAFVHHNLALSDTPESRGIIEQHFNVAPGGAARLGRWYGWFGVGQALAAVPLYAMGEVIARAFPDIEARHAATEHRGYPRSEYFAHLFVGWRNALLTAATGALIVLTARRFGVRRGLAWLGALAYGLATFAWPQARSTLSDVQATFCVFLAFWALAEVRAELDSGRAHLAKIALIGGAAGWAVLTRIAAAPVAVVLVAFAIATLWRRRADGSRRLRAADALALASPLALCAALFLYTNFARFGAPFETGYGVALSGGTFFSYPPLYGLAGLLVAPGKGLLWMAPALVLLPWAMRPALERRLGWWLTAACLIAIATIVPVACTQTWHGAWTYGPRYLLPLLPIAWLGVMLAVDAHWQRRWMRVASASLVALGLAVAIPGALVDHSTHEELALAAARIEWPSPGGRDAREQDDARFLSIQWDWRFAAPWAHWRILLHRLRGLGEDFSARELFHVDSDARLTPGAERERGFRHLAWVDLRERLNGSPWPGAVLCVLLLVAGACAAHRGLRAGNG